jgi:hypothetical protein
MSSVTADDVRSSRLLWVAAALSAVAGVIHWVVSPAYLRQWWGYGYFFIWAGVLQMGFAFIIFLLPWLYASSGVSPSRQAAVARSVYLLGALGNAAIIALYIVTRTLGVPFVGPAANIVLPVTPVSVIATAAELVLVVILLMLARQQTPEAV